MKRITVNHRKVSPLPFPGGGKSVKGTPGVSTGKPVEVSPKKGQARHPVETKDTHTNEHQMSNYLPYETKGKKK